MILMLFSDEVNSDSESLAVELLRVVVCIPLSELVVFTAIIVDEDSVSVTGMKSE